MRKIALLVIGFVMGCAVATAQEVECKTFHYATNDGVELYLDRHAVDMTTEKPRPCMIFVFGGGFVRGERNHEYYHRYFEHLAKEGIVVATIDYRLGLKDLGKKSGEKLGIRGMIDAMTNAVNIASEDIYSATLFVLDNAEEWGVDPEMIMLSGSSAGAIASLQAEYMRCNDHKLARVLPEGFRYAAVISCAGAIYSADGKPKFKSAPAPILLFHGSSDSNVPYNRASVFGVGFYGSKYIAKQLDKLRSPYMFYSAEYIDHSMAGIPLIYQCDLIVQFIEDYVKEGRKQRTVVDASLWDGEKRPTRFTAKDYLKTNYAGKAK